MRTAEPLPQNGQGRLPQPRFIRNYFRLFYQATVPDAGGCAVQSAREKLHFEEVRTLFNFIDADSIPLLIESARMEDGKTVEDWRKRAAAKGFFTPDEWRAIQPYIVNLAYPAGEMTRTFLSTTDSELVSKDDDLRALRRMKLPNLYSDGELLDLANRLEIPTPRPLEPTLVHYFVDLSDRGEILGITPAYGHQKQERCP